MALDQNKLRAAGLPQDIIKLLTELQGIAGRAADIEATVKKHLYFVEGHAKNTAAARALVDAAKGNVDTAAGQAADSAAAAKRAAEDAAIDAAPAAAAAIRAEVKNDADRAQEAAGTAAAAAADQVRVEVKTDADRAAAAKTAAEAAAATVSLGTVRQLDDGTWPARPNNPVVHWIGWDHPGPTRMGLDDIFIGPATPPTAPEQIVPDDWDFFNAMDGSRAVLRLQKAPAAARPAVLRYEYRITYTDAQGAQVVGAPVQFPMTVGDTFLTGYTEGQVLGAEIRAVNVKGAGPWSTVKATTVSTAPISDNFNRANQNLRTSPLWVDTQHSGQNLVIVSNTLRMDKANGTGMAYLKGYFPANQFMQATVVQADTATRLWDHGLRLTVRSTSFGSGYSLRLRSTGWAIMRGSTVLTSGTLSAAAPFTARIEAIGTTITALINGAVVGSVTDATITAGNPGIALRHEGRDNIVDDAMGGVLL